MKSLLSQQLANSEAWYSNPGSLAPEAVFITINQNKAFSKSQFSDILAAHSSFQEWVSPTLILISHGRCSAERFWLPSMHRKVELLT